MPLFPTTLIDGQIVYVNGTNYFWSSSRQTWKRVLANALSATTSTSSSGSFVGNLQAFANVIVADGISSSFALAANISNQAQLVVHVDGIYQIPGVNFTANGNVLIFDSTPTANSEIVVQNAIFAGGSGAATGVATVTVSSNAPVSPSDGALWLDNDNAKLAVYLSGGWVEVSSGAVNYTANAFVASGDIATSANINANLVIANYAVYSDMYVSNSTAISVGTTSTVIDSWPMATYRTAKYIISVTGNTSYQATEALVIHNNTTSFLTTYASIYTGANALMSFSTNIVSNNVVLYATGTVAGNTVRLEKTYVRT